MSIFNYFDSQIMIELEFDIVNKTYSDLILKYIQKKGM